MVIDIQIFNKLNVTDSCSVYNILSSNLLFITALREKCVFSITKYVEYECLYKERSKMTEADQYLQKRLQHELDKKNFNSYTLTIDDLHEVSKLEDIKKLGKGELSSIAFAKRTNQAIITDDQNARKLSHKILGLANTQTTSHLLGWLLFHRYLTEFDLPAVVSQHRAAGGQLEKYFNAVNEECLHIRLMLR